MFYSQFKKKPTKVYVALLDIGAGSIGTAIAGLNSRFDKGEIVYIKRYPIPHAAAEAGQTTALRAVSEVLLKAGRDLAKDGVKTLKQTNRRAKITDFQVNVSAPLSQVVVKNFRYQTKKPFWLNKKLFKAISDNIARQVWRDLKASDPADYSDLVMIDSSIISAWVDGYDVDMETLNRKATNVELVHLSSLIRHDLMTMIEAIKERTFPIANLSIHSAMFIYYNLMNLNVPGATNACIFDVADEVTDIGVIEKGVLRYVGRVPTGVHTIARTLQKDTNIPFAEALTLIRHGSNLGLSHGLAGDLIKTKYRAALELELKSASNAVNIPPVLFVRTRLSEPSLLDEVALAALKEVCVQPGRCYAVTDKVMISNWSDDISQTDTILQATVDFFHKTRQ